MAPPSALSRLQFFQLLRSNVFITEILIDRLKKDGINNCRLEGRDSGDWKLIDAIDIIVHIFHPEKRKFYNLEKMWAELIPKERLTL